MVLTLCVNAQTYKPFPIDSAIWGFHFTGPSGNSNTKEIIKGDTILGGNTYHKIYSHMSALMGFYRENSKKILAKVIGYSDTSEILIYDYNLNVGDTFYDKRSAYTPSLVTFKYKYILTSITTSSITLDVRKQYNFNYVGQSPVTTYSNLGPSCNFYWIEGIGSTKGIFNNRSSVEGTECHMAALISVASFAYLKCFEHKNTQYMPQSCLTLGLKEFAPDFNFKIYPNPTIGLLNLEAEKGTRVKVINVLGELVKEEELKSIKQGIDISNLKNGIYFLQVYDKENLIGTTKIVKE